MANGVIEVEARASLQNLSIEGEIDGNKLNYGPTKLYDYEKLINKPQIEGVTLIGNKQLSDLGLKEISNQNIEDILSSFPEVNDIQTGDMFPLLSGGDTNAKIDYATLADAIIAKLKSENVVQTQTNNANKLISAALAYSMNQSILQLEEDTSTEQEEKSVTAGIVTVEDADGGDAGLTLNLEPHQSGSGDPSPENIRPISGYDAVNVVRAGKNLISYKAPVQFTQNGITWTLNSDGSVVANGTATANSEFRIDNSNLKLKQGVYTLSGCPTGGGVGSGATYNIRVFSNPGGFSAYDTGTGDTLNVPKGGEGYPVTVRCIVYSGTTVSNLIFKPMLRLASDTDDTYEPYSVQTYPITFPSSAGTVYGGTLDVTTGVLTVDRAYDQMTYSYLSGLTENIYIGFESNVSQVGGNAVWVRNWNYSNAAPRKVGGIKATCNAFPISMHDNKILSSQYRIYFGVGSMTTVAEFLTAVQTLESNGGGLYIAYELATPTTYQLTPIEVTTLLGDNTIWMDAEGTIKLDYKTNAIATKGDVNNALARIKALAKITEAIAPVESSYTATQNYAIGDYLIVDYKLYKVTAAITSGATITEGTNVTATTIMAEIQALA